MNRAAAVTYGNTVIAEVDSVFAAEALIGLIEDCDPVAVHAGEYGIDATEAADAEYHIAAQEKP